MRDRQLGQKLLTAATANAVGKVMTVADYKNIMVMVTVTTPFSTGKLQFLGSINDIDNPASFAGGFAGASKTNQIALLGYAKMIDGVVVSGATGIDMTVAGTYLVELNVNGITQFAPELVSLTGAGEVTVTASGYGEGY